MSRLRIYFFLIACIPSICLAQQTFFDSPLSLLYFVEEHPEDSVYLNGVDIQCRSNEWMLEHMVEAQKYLNGDNKFIISKTVFLDEVNFIEDSDFFFFIFENCVFEKSIKVKIAEGSLPLAFVNSEFHDLVELTDFNYQSEIICEKNIFHETLRSTLMRIIFTLMNVNFYQIPRNHGLIHQASILMRIARLFIYNVVDFLVKHCTLGR